MLVAQLLIKEISMAEFKIDLSKAPKPTMAARPWLNKKDTAPAPVVEAPKVEEPKVEAPAAEEPKAEEPK